MSKREYFSVNSIEPQVRSHIEQRWDVVGLGFRLHRLDFRKSYSIRYFACGFTPDEGGVVIRYRKRDQKAIAARRGIVPGVQPHDHP